jgi:hypothetical protein
VSTSSFSQKKQVKSTEQQAKEYMIKFMSLNQAQKAQASRELAYFLNNTDSQTKVIWLRAMEPYNDKPKTTNTLSSEEIEKGIIAITKINIVAHFFDLKQDSLVSIKIIKKMSNKDWALKENVIIQKKIDSVTIFLAELKKERLNLKKSLPENYNYEETPIDSLSKSYYRIKELEGVIPRLTTELIHYPDFILKGNYENINWDDEKPRDFLVEVISLPNDGLDNNIEKHYFTGKYEEGRVFSIEKDRNGHYLMNSKDLCTELMNKKDEFGRNSDLPITKEEDAYKVFNAKYSSLSKRYPYGF